MKFKKILCFVLMSLLIFSGCKGKRKTVTTFALDTKISITTDIKDEQMAENALDLCKKYEKVFSRTDKNSELYRINNNEIKTPSNDIIKLCNFSIRLSKETGGMFDLTICPLSDLWDVQNRKVPPTDEEIQNALSSVDYNKIVTSPFSLNGAKLDFGAVAKGYIADQIGIMLDKNNVSNVIVDLGGNVLLRGEYTVGIRNPKSPDSLFAKITLSDMSAVTSGNYERYFEYKGKRYHHIINAKSGYPSDNGVSSVTVISNSSQIADGLSTAVFLMGSDGLELCKKFNSDAVIIYDNGDIKTTDGFKEKYKFELIK